MHGTETPKGGDLVYRHRIATRAWHWLNAFVIFTMIGSGLMIFNAHPHLYWGQYGANFDPPWLDIGNDGTHGWVRIAGHAFDTTGVFGISPYHDGGINHHAFPDWLTLPGRYNLAKARHWHLFFAWALVIPWSLFLIAGFINRHFVRDLAPSREELRPSHILHDIVQHARLRFPTGAAALHHNILQKISYLGVIFGLIPLMVLSGLTLSPGWVAAWPWLIDLFGGRASARSVHFIGMALIVAFIAVHLIMVVLAGPFNEVRSMVTGWFRLPRDRAAPVTAAEGETA